jgi:hypothetical protein
LPFLDPSPFGNNSEVLRDAFATFSSKIINVAERRCLSYRSSQTMENIMQISQFQTRNLLLSAHRIRTSIVGWFVRTLRGLWGRRVGGDEQVAARYEGRAWCDSTERQLTNEIMTGVRTTL